MSNLENAVINEFNAIKSFNENDIAIEHNKWENVTVEDLNIFNYDDEHKSLYTQVREYISVVLDNNNLSFMDARCYGYLDDNCYEIIKNILTIN